MNDRVDRCRIAAFHDEDRELWLWSSSQTPSLEYFCRLSTAQRRAHVMRAFVVSNHKWHGSQHLLHELSTLSVWDKDLKAVWLNLIRMNRFIVKHTKQPRTCHHSVVSLYSD